MAVMAGGDAGAAEGDGLAMKGLAVTRQAVLVALAALVIDGEAELGPARLVDLVRGVTVDAGGTADLAGGDFPAVVESFGALLEAEIALAVQESARFQTWALLAQLTEKR